MQLECGKSAETIDMHKSHVKTIVRASFHIRKAEHNTQRNNMVMKDAGKTKAKGNK